MGLFDAFGAGGGKLNIEPLALQVTPGGQLKGKVTFTAGKRAQNITNIKLRFTQTMTQMVQPQPGQLNAHGQPQGPTSQSHTNPVCPEVQLAGAFATEPGNRYDFPFEFQLPAQMVNSTPNAMSYRLAATADIDGEVDPGDGQDIQVVGGQMAGMGQPMMAGQIGAPVMGMGGQIGQPMMGQPMIGGQMGAPMAGVAPAMAMAGAMLGAVQGMQPGMQPGMPMQPVAQPGMPAPGTPVIAQWQDGQWHNARVVQVQGTMVAVDWDNPALGASSWVQIQQVQPQQAMHQPQMGMPMSGMPMPGMPMPGMPMQQAPLAPGSLVYAQWQDGQWHPAQLVQMQNNMYGVDWENPALGASSWVQVHQVRPR